MNKFDYLLYILTPSDKQGFSQVKIYRSINRLIAEKRWGEK